MIFGCVPFMVAGAKRKSEKWACPNSRKNSGVLGKSFYSRIHFVLLSAEHKDVTSKGEPAGNVKAHSTRLLATKQNGATKVQLTINQTVNVRVPQFFVSEADRRVQLAAVNSTTEQEKAIRSFIALYQDELIVLPKLR